AGPGRHRRAAAARGRAGNPRCTGGDDDRQPGDVRPSARRVRPSGDCRPDARAIRAPRVDRHGRPRRRRRRWDV
ncbi:MAG: hypothetical protein AVDCRST_MAG59-5139, partial [uncultured Thermomicrobiales bacterium]